MDLVMLLITLAVVAVIVAIAAGRLPGGMPDPSSTVPPVRLPDRALTGADVERLRFVSGLRGYRMDQVDQALDRLGRELDQVRALVPQEQLRAHDQAAGQPLAYDLGAGQPLAYDLDADQAAGQPQAHDVAAGWLPVHVEREPADVAPPRPGAREGER